MLTNRVEIFFSHPGDGRQFYLQSGDENSRYLELALMQWNGTTFEAVDTTGCTATMVYSYNNDTQATGDIVAERQEDGTFLTLIPIDPLTVKGEVKAQLSLRKTEDEELMKSAVLVISVLESIAADAEYTEQAVTQLTSVLADVEAGIAAAYEAAAVAYAAINNTCGIRWDKATAQCVRTGGAAAITTTTTNFGHFGSVNANKDNPFDNIYPWSGIKLCNIDLDAYYAMVAAGDFTADDLLDCVVSWEGDPDFSYTHADGVWRYTPEFWGGRREDASYVYLEITDKPLGGFVHYPASIKGRWHGGVYTRTVNGSSKTVLLPKVGMPGKNVTMANLHTYAVNFNATLDSIFSVDADLMLYLVEYANFNAQTKLGNGVSDLYQQNSDLLQTNVSASAVVQVLKSVVDSSADVIVGAIFDIGTSNGGAQIGSYIISAVATDGTDPTKTNVTLTTDGTTPASITATTSHYWSIHGLMNKATSEIGSASGYIGTNSKSNAYYRGAVMFGNMWMYILGAYRQTGTGHIWIANDDDEADAVDALNTGVHYDTGIVLPESAANYINALAGLSVSGLLCIPPFCTAVGGSSSNPVGDYCYVPTLATGNTILLLGGGANIGSSGGPFYGSWGNSASSADWSLAARPRLKTP